MSDWAVIAELTKAKTLEGDLFVRSVKGLPFLLQEGMDVVFVPPVLKVPRQATVTSITEKGKDTFQVSFSGIDSIDLSEQLVGHFCLVKKSDLPENYEAGAFADLAGFTLNDVTGAVIGKVIAMEENPAHPLLVVSYNGGEVRIPLVDDFLVSLDEPARTIVMDIPSGLLSL